MISFTEQQTLYGDLSNNTASTNLTRGGKLANIEHRYLLQQFFNNETSYSIQTVGAQSLTTTGAMVAGATSATLTSGWSYHTTLAWTTFSNGDVRQVQYIAGSTAITWQVGLSDSATVDIEMGGAQYYPLPPNYSKLKTITITIGNLTWTLDEILTRNEWDRLNVFPYYADIPANFFMYPGGDHGPQVGIWPIPSSTGNIITYNYKFRVPDLSMADYSTGTVSVNNGSTAVTGSGTTFLLTSNRQLESRWIKISQDKGDNLWYQIASVDSTTGITLYQPYQGINVTGGSFVIGQMPLLAEDFQDMLVWKPLMNYYTSIVPDKVKFEQFSAEYDKKMVMLKDYSGSNSTSVNLRKRPQYKNPNLYGQTFG